MKFLVVPGAYFSRCPKWLAPKIFYTQFYPSEVSPSPDVTFESWSVKPYRKIGIDLRKVCVKFEEISYGMVMSIMISRINCIISISAVNIGLIDREWLGGCAFAWLIILKMMNWMCVIKYCQQWNILSADDSRIFHCEVYFVRENKLNVKIVREIDMKNSIIKWENW